MSMAHQPPSTAPLRVLLVDDDEDQYVLTRAHLQDDGSGLFDLDWAATFDEGLRRFETGRYDVALVDYQLGDRDGLDLLRTDAVRRAGVPAIMMTGAGSDIVDSMAMQAGAVDYLVKQEVTAPALKRALRYAIEGHRMLAQLRQHEGSLRALLEDSSDVILLVNPEGRVIFASDSVEHLEGCTAKDLLGRAVTDRVHPSDAGRLRAAVERCARAEVARAFVEYRQQHLDGTWRHREATVVNRLAHPGIAAIVLTYRDVTERKQAEREHAHLAAIVESSADAIFSRSLEGDIRSWNSGAERIFGFAPEEIIGRNVADLVPPDDARDLPARFDRIRAGESLTQLEVTCVRKDGSRFPALLTVSPMRDHDGRIVGAASVVHDITERRRFQAALIESEAEYRSTFEEAPVGIAHITLDGHVIRANASILAMFGLAGVPADRIDFDAVTHPEDRDLDRDAGLELYSGARKRHAIDKRFKRPDGTYFWGHVTTSLHRDASGAPRYLIAMIEDVTERRRAQQEINHLFNLSPDMIGAFDYEGRFLRVNPAWTQVLGYPSDELVGRRFIELVHPDDVESTLAELGDITTGKIVFGFTNRYRTTSGEFRYIEWHSKADAASGVIYAVARDTTERRSLELQLNQAQKMEAVGRLAGGVAHDFNNLLTAILGFAEMTLEQLEPGDPRRDDVQQIMNAGNSAASLTRQLLAFSRKQIMEPQLIDMSAVVASTQELLRRLIGEDITLVTEVGTDACLVNADKGQIEQVIMNLAVNARDAMPDGGTLTISTTVVDHDEAFVEANPGAAAGPHIRLAIADTGTGMPPHVLAHVFEPFFTTKAQGKGTGLGLATVYGIIKQSGGHIAVESTVGSGTTFLISLPLVTGQPDADRATDVCLLDARGSETILFVEDQQEVRDVIRRSLVSRGYRVLEAADGAPALDLLARHNEDVHLLLTDVIMPAMSGRQLAETVAARTPGVRVLYMSGYTDDAVLKDGVLSAGIDFIRKPFTSEQLASRVRAALDRQAPS